MIKAPMPDMFFPGYAGGINPENVMKIINLIEKENIWGYPYYIDMESGIRTDNIFSVKKCRDIKKLIDNAS
jgi:phosphoribosylanthranilate isomerase